MKQTKKLNDKNETTTPFSKKDLDHFKKLLLKKREEAFDELDKIGANIKNITDSDDTDFSSIAHHMGDMASNTEEVNLNYQFVERTRQYVDQIDEALKRMEKGTYGICIASGKPIARGRLEAVPHTRYSMEAKEKGPAEDL